MTGDTVIARITPGLRLVVDHSGCIVLVSACKPADAEHRHAITDADMLGVALANARMEVAMRDEHGKSLIYWPANEEDPSRKEARP